MSYIFGVSPEEQKQIEKISVDTTLNEHQKSVQRRSAIQEIKKTPQSPFAVTVSITNSMMGSALLVMPVNFYKSGMISGIITSIIMAYISYKTCNLVIRHSKDDEIDYPEAIKRVLGDKWEKIYNFSSMINLFFVAIIHFILMANCIYTILKNIFPDSKEWALPEDIVWDKMSLQYSGLICFVICCVILSFKDLSMILKIVDKGIYAIMTYCLFITFMGIYS